MQRLAFLVLSLCLAGLAVTVIVPTGSAGASEPVQCPNPPCGG